MSDESTPGVNPAPEAANTTHAPEVLSASMSKNAGVPSAAHLPLTGTPDFLMGVRLTLTVEVGRVQMPISEVLELGPGSVIELQRSTSEPVEIHANGRCIGRGEIVVLGEQFGVRITEVGNQS